MFLVTHLSVPIEIGDSVKSFQKKCTSHKTDIPTFFSELIEKIMRNKQLGKAKLYMY